MLVARYRVRIEGGHADGPLLPEDALDLELERRVGGGLLDRWTIHNRSAVPWQGRLRLEVDADFADIAEVGAERRQKGEITARQGPRSLELRYEARREGRRFQRGVPRFQRGVRVRVLPGRGAGSAGADTALEVEATDTGMAMRAWIGPRGSIQVRVRVSSRVNGRWRSPDLPEDDGDASSRARQRAAWRISRLRIEGARAHPASRSSGRSTTCSRSATQDLETDLLDRTGGLAPARAGSSTPACPSFTGFFGRDALTAGWQSAMAGTGRTSRRPRGRRRRPRRRGRPVARRRAREDAPRAPPRPALDARAQPA